MTVFVYVNTSKQVGDAEHVKVFATTDAAETWFEENDPEGVPLSTRFWSEPHRPQDRLCDVGNLGAGDRLAGARVAVARLRPGPHVELHSTLGVVEVPAKDAHIRGIGADHLAHFEGICLRQPVQHGARYQARGSILLPAGSCILRSVGWCCRD
jgi:hypothetical protein